MVWIQPIVGGMIRGLNGGSELLHQFSPLPLIASFEVNNKCGQNCCYCYLEKRSECAHVGDKGEKLTALMDRCAELGIRIFTISGREPLLDGDSIRHLKHLDTRRHAMGSLMRYGFNTNGLNIGRYFSVMGDLRPDWVTVSIDGIGRRHDTQRGEGTYEMVESNLLRLMTLPQYAKKIEVSTTVIEDDPSDVFELSRYLNRVGVGMHCLTPVISMTGNGDYHQPNSKHLLDHYVQHAEEIKDVEVYFILMKTPESVDIISGYSLAPGYKNLMDQDCYRVEGTSNIYILSHNATRYFRITSDGHLLRGASLFERDYEAASLGRPSAETLPAMLQEVFARDNTLEFYRKHFSWLN